MLGSMRGASWLFWQEQLEDDLEEGGGGPRGSVKRVSARLLLGVLRRWRVSAFSGVTSLLLGAQPRHGMLILEYLLRLICMPFSSVDK